VSWAFAFLALFALAGPATGTEPVHGAAAQPPKEGIDVSRLSKPPKLTRQAPLEYPEAARGSGIEAEVELLVDIDERGEVTGAAVDKPATPAGFGFDEAALLAAYSLGFEAAEIDGIPVAVQVAFTFRFRPPRPALDGGAADTRPGGPPTADSGLAPAAPGPGGLGRLEGRLLERGRRTPLSAIALLLVREDQDGGADEPRLVTAGDDGSFVADGLPPGRYLAAIRSDGFLPFETYETVGTNETVRATYYIERDDGNSVDVVVTASKPRKEVSRTVVERAVIEKLPGAADDPLAVLQNLAGVARVPFGSGEIIVRGSAPRDTRINVGGMEVPTAYHFGGLRSVLPLTLVDSIDFYPGNFSAFYGRGTGGVIDVNLKRLEPRRVGGYVDVNLLDSGMYLEAPVGKRAAIAFSARRSYIDAILAAAFPSDASIGFATAPRYYDYQLAAQYRPDRRHDLRFMLFGSDDRIALLFKNPADFDPQAGGNTFGLSTKFYRSLFSYTYSPSPSLTNSVRLSQGRDWLTFGIGVLSFNVDVYRTQMRETLRNRFGESFAASLGLDVQFLRGEGTIALPPRQKEGEPPANTDYSAIRRANFDGLQWWSPGLFAEAEWRPWSTLLLVPGLRFDYSSRLGELWVEPRLAVRRDLSDRLVAKGGVGLFHQEPDFGEDYPGFGNPRLTAEKAWHYSAGLEWRISNGLSVDGTLFYKRLYDLVSPTTAVTIDSGVVQPLIYDNGGRGRVVGAELLLRRDFGERLSGWIAYTFSRAERLDSGADTWRLFDYDQTHILTAIGSFRLSRHWTLGSRFRYVSGNPRTPIVGSLVNATADRYEPQFGAVNSARNPAFHQLDVRIDRRWVFNRWILNAYLDVQNIYNHKSPEGLAYSYDYRQSAPQGGLPILTIFGLRAEI
jgi:TonB family protein